MLAFSNATIFRAITQKGRADSLFIKVVANFFHFILVQTVSLLLAIGSKATGNLVISGVGFTAMLYAVLTGVAIAGQLLHTARIFNATGKPAANPGEQSGGSE